MNCVFGGSHHNETSASISRGCVFAKKLKLTFGGLNEKHTVQREFCKELQHLDSVRTLLQ
jgi:hypothetical protein